jgi:hypothetical protein
MNRVLGVIVLALAGCVTQPQNDPGLLDNIARKTPEQIAKEREQDIESARQALEYQTYVCAQPDPQRRELIEKTAAEHGWRIICKD